MERSSATFLKKRLFEFAGDPGYAECEVGETPEELACRVLFSENLEEKLRLAALRLPSLSSAESTATRAGLQDLRPARPSHLRFSNTSVTRPTLPGRASLVDETQRGVLLHFFANHELLAAELMALALLKFPDAPAAFRQGLARTLREEQLHTRWYVNRMKECGVEFGQYPVSGFFWDAVSRMESPLDYVSRLSLTFEQANLDYSLHFGKMLEEAGDPKSAAILLRIYEDEISHVGYGLHWFRRWKEETESDWGALKKRLPFPLSPSRAKGNRTAFNREGRRAAGFDDDYIERLDLFERSKGRTPDVFYFNPDAEHRAAAWPRCYHPDQKSLSVARDLELLAAFLAKKDDVLLMRRVPSGSHLAKLRRCGFRLPELEQLSVSGGLASENLILRRKVKGIHPWAISPELPGLFGALSPTSTEGFAKTEWTPVHRSLFSKREQVRDLGRWMGLSHPCATLAELSEAIVDLQRNGCSDAVVKRPFSTAGSGMRKIRLGDSDIPLSSQVLSKDGVLLEPWHERVFDFSAQYRIEAGKARLTGFVEQIISPGGGYRGSLCRSKFCKGLDEDLARFLMNEALPLYQEDGELAADLASWASIHDYEGPLGVDAYVHRANGGRLELRAICEVNPRHTMGLVALSLKKQVAPDGGVKLEILKASDPAAASEQPIFDPEGRLRGGSVILTELLPESRFVAKLTLAKPQSLRSTRT